MMRLVQFVITKENNFSNAYKNNYMHAMRVVKNTARNNAEYIEKQIEYYHTNEYFCDCGETKLLSKMFRIDIPCSHIYKITQKFPKCPESIILKLSKSSNELTFLHENVSLPDVTPEFSAEKKIQMKAVKVIRKFSLFKGALLSFKNHSIAFFSKFTFVHDRERVSQQFLINYLI